MFDTRYTRLVPQQKDDTSPWKDLVTAEGESLLGEEPTDFEALASFIHMSDLHLCDAQSPARLEFLDRIADPDNPLSALVPYVGTYRAQEFLTAQVLEAMVDSANKITVGPLTGAPIDAVVVTGDVTDNAQLNELTWYKTILDGGAVLPASGNVNKSEGSHSSQSENYDPFYFHPDGPPAGQESDRPHLLHGFPHFKGVLAGSEAPFIARGLAHRWFAVHGNHDALLQGTAAPTDELETLVTGNQKLSGLKNFESLAELFGGFGEVGPATYPGFDELLTTEVTPDPRRSLTKIEDWVNIHTECGHDHGLDATTNQISYYFRDINPDLTMIALDTVNRWGGWQGCIHREQYDWLKKTLEDKKDKYIVFSSHHPLQDLFNGYHPEGELEPALKQEITKLLLSYPNVILWFSGHVHDHKISEVLTESGDHGFWEIRTGSHIDWPQQSRVIELVKVDKKIAIGTFLFNHSGPLTFTGTASEISDPIALAGFSRELSANDWQRQSGVNSLQIAEGTHADRNIWLWGQDPFAN